MEVRIRERDANRSAEAPPVLKRRSGSFLSVDSTMLSSVVDENDDSAASTPVEEQSSSFTFQDLSVVEVRVQQPPQRKELSLQDKALACLQELDGLLQLDLPKQPSISPLSSSQSPFRTPPSPAKPALKKNDSFDSTKKLQRSVSFSSLSIREYQVALGENPSVSYGPPIQLGWDFSNEYQVSLDQYEQARSPRRAPQIVPAVWRSQWLQRSASQEEIQSVIQEVKRVQHQRKVTDLLLPFSMMQEACLEVVGQVQQVVMGAS